MCDKIVSFRVPVTRKKKFPHTDRHLEGGHVYRARKVGNEREREREREEKKDCVECVQCVECG